MKKELKKIWLKEWEANVFGAGYGTGETPILVSLAKLFKSLDGNSYSYEVLEKELGDTATWLLINALDKGDIIEWGTSSRFGWLTSSGEYLKKYFDEFSVEELYEMLMDDEEHLCMCRGEVAGHDECGTNPLLDEKIAYKLLTPLETN